MKKVVEGLEVGFLEVVSDDSDCTSVDVSTAKKPTFRSHVYQLRHAVLFPCRTVAERMVQRHVQRVTNSECNVTTARQLLC